MRKREAEFTTKFKKWVIHRWTGGTAHFELKVTKNNTLPFSAVTEKQISNLKGAKRYFIHKFSDFDRMGTPFDIVFTNGGGSFVVIMFYRQGQKEFFMIDVDKFVEEQKTSTKKSLREEDARRIGTSYVLGV